MKPIGHATFPLVIGNKEYQNLIVTDIDEQFVLGFDFLAKYKCSIDAAADRSYTCHKEPNPKK